MTPRSAGIQSAPSGAFAAWTKRLADPRCPAEGERDDVNGLRAGGVERSLDVGDAGPVQQGPALEPHEPLVVEEDGHEVARGEPAVGAQGVHPPVADAEEPAGLGRGPERAVGPVREIADGHARQRVDRVGPPVLAHNDEAASRGHPEPTIGRAVDVRRPRGAERRRGHAERVGRGEGLRVEAPEHCRRRRPPRGRPGPPGPGTGVWRVRPFWVVQTLTTRPPSIWTSRLPYTPNRRPRPSSWIKPMVGRLLRSSLANAAGPRSMTRLVQAPSRTAKRGASSAPCIALTRTAPSAATTAASALSGAPSSGPNRRNGSGVTWSRPPADESTQTLPWRSSNRLSIHFEPSGRMRATSVPPSSTVRVPSEMRGSVQTRPARSTSLADCGALPTTYSPRGVPSASARRTRRPRAIPVDVGVRPCRLGGGRAGHVASSRIRRAASHGGA